jgi:hypothetical protein
MMTILKIISHTIKPTTIIIMRNLTVWLFIFLSIETTTNIFRIL